MRERNRERQRQRQTHRQTERQTEKRQTAGVDRNVRVNARTVDVLVTIPPSSARHV